MNIIREAVAISLIVGTVVSIWDISSQLRRIADTLERISRGMK